MLWRQRLLGTYFGQTSNWFLSHVKKTLVQCNCDPQLNHYSKMIAASFGAGLLVFVQLSEDWLKINAFPCESLMVLLHLKYSHRKVCLQTIWSLEAIFISLCHCLVAACLDRWILGCPCINNLQSADGVIGVFAEQWTKMAGLRPRMVFKWLSGAQSRGVRYIDISYYYDTNTNIQFHVSLWQR